MLEFSLINNVYWIELEFSFNNTSVSMDSKNDYFYHQFTINSNHGFTPNYTKSVMALFQPTQLLISRRVGTWQSFVNQFGNTPKQYDSFINFPV